MAVFPRADSAAKLLDMFASTRDPGRRAAILDTLVSREEYADALVEALTKGTIQHTDIPAYIARQLAVVSSNGSVFAKRWGLNETDAQEKIKLLNTWKKRLSLELLATANPVAGKKVFQRSCGICHQLYGEGTQIGPDLTGSNRANIDYFLINVLFPNEDVSPAFKLVTLTLSDGRNLTGNIINEDNKVVTFRQVGQTLRIDKAEIAKREVSEASMMPPGILDTLQRQDVRDLVAYLQTTSERVSGQ
jgi:putative heme-binding domain-containing protein